MKMISSAQNGNDMERPTPHLCEFSELADHFDELAALAKRGERVILTSDGRGMAVLIGMDEFEHYKAFLQKAAIGNNITGGFCNEHQKNPEPCTGSRTDPDNL